MCKLNAKCESRRGTTNKFKLSGSYIYLFNTPPNSRAIWSGSQSKKTQEKITIGQNNNKDKRNKKMATRGNNKRQTYTIQKFSEASETLTREESPRFGGGNHNSARKQFCIYSVQQMFITLERGRISIPTESKHS